MRQKLRTSLLAAGATGLLLGITVLTPPRAAAFGLGDIVALIQAVNAVGSKVAAMQSAIDGKLQTVQNYINNQLGDGFTQISNYIKGQTAAQAKIMNAADQANAIVAQQAASAKIVEQHVVNPQTCDSLTNGQSVVAAGDQTTAVAKVIANIQNARGEGQPGTPSYNGLAQGVGAMNKLHYSQYCSPNDQAAGLCSVSTDPDGDEIATSLLGQSTLNGQAGLNAANNYATVLLQPVAPAPLRGSQLAGNAGQTDAVYRRQYNAQESLARQVATTVIADRTPTVTLTTAQQAELSAEGKPVVTTASWLEALQLDVNRRESNIQWRENLVNEPPATVQREIAVEMAENNYIALARFRLDQQRALLEAARLADTAQYHLPLPASTPIPIVSNAN
jgi:hypothetical protein